MADYEYKLLTQDEQDEITASFLIAQERDLFCHQLNKERFTEMLKSLPEGDWKKRIKTLSDDTDKRIIEVDSLIKATKLPSTERLNAALQRVKAKEATLKP